MFSLTAEIGNPFHDTRKQNRNVSQKSNTFSAIIDIPVLSLLHEWAVFDDRAAFDNRVNELFALIDTLSRSSSI